MKPANQSSKIDVLQTICGLCASGCGMRIEINNGKISKIRGDKSHPFSKGRLCTKGAYAAEIIYAPDRIRQPLLKSRRGFEKVSWDKALGVVAEKFNTLKEKYGPDTFTLFRGHIPGPPVLDAFAQLFAALGSPNLTGAANLCHIPTYLGFHLVYGLNPYPIGTAVPDYANTRCMVVWGAHPSKSTRVSTATEMIPVAKAKGAKLIVVDPVMTDVAAKADEWLQVEPGTDMALGLSILHVIIKSDLYDKKFVKQWTVGFDELAAHIQTYSPRWAEVRTGVPAEQIKNIARILAATRPALIDFGNGLDQHPNSVQTARVLGMILALTGNLDTPGGNCFYPHPPMKPYPSERPLAKHVGAEKYPLFPATAFPEVLDGIEFKKPGGSRGMLVYHGNPVLSAANEKRIRNAMSELELLVAVELFKTATSEIADVVLPDTTTFERWGFKTQTGPDGGFIMLNRKVIEPLWDSRPWYEIEFELAKRLNIDNQYTWQTGRQYVDHRIASTGSDFETLESEGYLKVTEPVKYRKYHDDGFKTDSGKIELFSHKMEKMDLDPLPVYQDPPESHAAKKNLKTNYPLLGTTRRPGVYIHTRYRNIPALRRREPHAGIRIHPDDAGIRSIKDGDTVRVTSREGEIQVKAILATAIRPGMVVIDYGWGNPGDGGDNVNRLTSDDTRDPVAASTPNRRFLCEVVKVV